jgi:hypothetical protein
MLPEMPGKPDATGFVRMASSHEAQYVIDALNGNIPQGLPVTKPLVIKYAGQRVEGNESAGCKGGGKSSQSMQQAPAAQGPCVNLYLTGLPLTLSQDDVRQFFAQYGTVHSAKILPPSANRPTAPGFCLMDEIGGKWCVENLNGFQPDGFTVPISVSIAQDKNGKGKGGAGQFEGIKGSFAPTGIKGNGCNSSSTWGAAGSRDGGKSDGSGSGSCNSGPWSAGTTSGGTGDSGGCSVATASGGLSGTSGSWSAGTAKGDNGGWSAGPPNCGSDDSDSNRGTAGWSAGAANGGSSGTDGCGAAPASGSSFSGGCGGWNDGSGAGQRPGPY